MLRVPKLVVVLVLLGAGTSGCGGTPENAVVVRIGDTAITKASVDHWARVIEHGGPITGFRGKTPRGTSRERALDVLISAYWLIGEAARQGVAVTGAPVHEALLEREQDPSFRKQLHAIGETIADTKLELRAELAGEAVRELLARRAGETKPREVLDFYRQNPMLFSTPEARATDLVENLPSATAAKALVRRVGTGSGFAKVALHEQVMRTPGFTLTAEKIRVVNAIFAAKPGAVSAPMLLNGSWAVFVVRRTIAPRVEPFATVRRLARRALDVRRQRELATRFDAEYRAWWTAKTTCRSGWLAPGCPQVHGLLGRYEDPFSLRAHPLLREQGLEASQGE